MNRDPLDRCGSTNGARRCVLRPHNIGPHVGLINEGKPDATPEWWDRAGERMLAPLTVPPPPLLIVLPANPTLVPTHGGGFLGDPCDHCGMFALIRTGKCTTCLNCGESGGCG